MLHADNDDDDYSEYKIQNADNDDDDISNIIIVIKKGSTYVYQ